RAGSSRDVLQSLCFFFSSRRRHTRFSRDWSSDVCSSDLGAHYKFDITGPDGTRRAKADPMARASEVPPFNNSVVTTSTHRWSDEIGRASCRERVETTVVGGAVKQNESTKHGRMVRLR